MSVSTALFKGASVLTPSGPKVVVGLSPLSVALRGVDQRVEEVDWWEIEGARQVFKGRVDAVTYSVSVELEGLSLNTRE
ncbi:hypothetical protein [Brevibacterium sp. FME17]|uniref:hypothetical protein n=1 Tax=Brevibacterium sp. FME17 TaxID=2742606 RepID=UPI001866D38A|nr:hypothetical protein [Brevibacterium sp. FME17]